MLAVGGNAVSDEVLGDVVVLATGQDDPVGMLDRAPRTPDLLVVGDGRAGPLVVDDEPEVGLVEAHPERDRGHERLQLVGDEGVLERLALLGREVGVVRAGIDAGRAQERGDALRVGDRQAVDDAAARPSTGSARRARPAVPPGSASGMASSTSERAGQRPAQDRRAVAELLGDVGDDPVVGGGRGRQHRDARVEHPQDPADAPVVRPEVVAPVGDAVRLVDDEQADRALDARQDVAQKRSLARRSGEMSRTSMASAASPSCDGLPLVDVARVDRRRPEAQAAGHRDLVAHQGEQRADDERRAVAAVAPDAGRDPVHEALAPARALDDERAAAVVDDGLDRLALALAEGRLGAEHALEVSGQVIHRCPSVAARRPGFLSRSPSATPDGRLGHRVHAKGRERLLSDDCRLGGSVLVVGHATVGMQFGQPFELARDVGRRRRRLSGRWSRSR